MQEKKEDWSYRGEAGEGGSFSENDQWWNSKQKHVRIGTFHRMESLKCIKSRRISSFSVSEDHTHMKKLFFSRITFVLNIHIH